MTAPGISGATTPDLASAVDELAVTVVIPTVGRSSLAAAVRSAVGQTCRPVQIVVVVDGPDGDGLAADVRAEPLVDIVTTGGDAGPGGARMIGARRATGDLVAFLDDDDEWLVDKLERQVAAYRLARRSARLPLVSCPVLLVNDAGAVLDVAPRRAMRGPGEDVSEFLFRRSLRRDSGFGMGSSTLLCDRELLRAVPWDTERTLHEDWEWVIRAARHPEVRVVMLPDPLVRYLSHPPGTSASQPRGGWRRSEAFAQETLRSPRARGDFLLAVTALMALSEGSRVEALRVAARAGVRARPGLAAWGLFVTHVVAPRGGGSALGRIRGVLHRRRPDGMPAP
ncbi:glycosyltransferase family A protein [Frankia sp. AgKG'84/4]